ncbi:hypothetical protein M917_2753 [Psychrobacter aquaticus CMS 56]|jgi:hypothetical protein|uniref:Uncharacterized protein n=1 Tax=Psychrobacter aquaticus CMS 56 TaxID=1354303 RepID=U4T2A0_9GAMM|nr:hypothetical protein M917_2753 [Psychrobacter aquaticus CMS 56]
MAKCEVTGIKALREIQLAKVNQYRQGEKDAQATILYSPLKTAIDAKQANAKKPDNKYLAFFVLGYIVRSKASINH